MIDLNLPSQDEQEKPLDLNIIPSQISEEDEMVFSNEENIEDIKIGCDEDSDDNKTINARDKDKQEEYIIIENNDKYNLSAKIAKAAKDWKEDDVMELTFESVEEAHQFYKAYSMEMGFDIRFHNKREDCKTGKVRMRRWVCSSQGTRDIKHIQKTDRIREPKPITRFNCKAAFRVNFVD